MTLSTLGSICCLVILACGFFILIYQYRKGELFNYRERQIERRLGAMSLADVDDMTGEEFELWCGNLLRGLGFTNVQYTPVTGDQGVDIVAVRDGVRYAVQCKRYSGAVDNSPVQEVMAGKVMYDCLRCIVMTNSTFTAGARRLAEANRVELWDRAKLAKLRRAAASGRYKASRQRRAKQSGSFHGRQNPWAATAKPAKGRNRLNRDEWDHLFDMMSILEDDDD